MAIKAIHDQNVFMPSMCLLLAVFVLVAYWPRLLKGKAVDLERRRWWLKLLGILCAINFVLAFTFEVYYHVLSCTVSPKYFDTNITIARFVTTKLVSLGVPFWAESATLLEALRLGTINPWDHDTDYSMIDPGPQGVADLLAVFNTKEGHTHANYVPERRLIQIMNKVGAQGPHVDIWFWDEETDETGARFVVGAISDFNFYKRPYGSIYPLQLVPWAGGFVNVPHQAHYLMRGEYGHSYMSKLTFKGDCTHNIFSARWWPF